MAVLRTSCLLLDADCAPDNRHSQVCSSEWASLLWFYLFLLMGTIWALKNCKTLGSSVTQQLLGNKPQLESRNPGNPLDSLSSRTIWPQGKSKYLLSASSWAQISKEEISSSGGPTTEFSQTFRHPHYINRLRQIVLRVSKKENQTKFENKPK